MVTFEEVITSLKPPVNRNTIIEYMSHGQNIPKTFKTLAYMSIQRLKQSELDNLGNIIIQVLHLLKDDKTEELTAYLKENNIPESLIGVIISNAKNYLKE